MNLTSHIAEAARIKCKIAESFSALLRKIYRISKPGGDYLRLFVNYLKLFFFKDYLIYGLFSEIFTIIGIMPCVGIILVFLCMSYFNFQIYLKQSHDFEFGLFWIILSYII